MIGFESAEQEPDPDAENTSPLLAEATFQQIELELRRRYSLFLLATYRDTGVRATDGTQASFVFKGPFSALAGMLREIVERLESP